MLNEEKIWIHFGANGFDVYTLKNSVLKLISRKKIVLETSATIEELSKFKITKLLATTKIIVMAMIIIFLIIFILCILL